MKSLIFILLFTFNCFAQENNQSIGYVGQPFAGWITQTGGLGSSGQSVPFLFDNSGNLLTTTSIAFPPSIVISGGVAITQSIPLSVTGSGVSVTNAVTVNQGTNPWVVSGGVAVTSSVLPTGAATSALQTTGNTTAASILTQLQGGLATTSSALPAGAATSALQTSMINQLSGGVAVTSSNTDSNLTAGTAPLKATVSALQYNSTSPVLTTGQTASIQGDSAASLKTVLAGPNGALNTVRPDSEIKVAIDPTSLFYDTFDTALDTTNRWTASGTVTPTSGTGSLSVSAGTTALATSVLTSQPTFPLLGNQFNQALGIIQVDSSTKTGSYRFFGFGSAQASPTVALPILNGVGFEWSDTDGVLRGVVWSNGTKTLTTSLSASQPTDGALHRYVAYYKTSRVYFEIDNVSVGTISYPNPQLSNLPEIYLNVNAGSTVSPAAVFNSSLAAMADTSRNNTAISDGTLPWRKGSVSALGGLGENLVQVGGISVTAGSSIAANSVPVVIASNQGSIPTLTMDGAGSGISSQTSPASTTQRYLNSAVIGDDPAIVTNAISVLNGDIYPSIDLTGYAGASVQITGAFTATISFQGSNDSFTTVSAVNCWSTITINAAPVTTAAAAGTFYCPRVYKQFRVRVTAYTSGTITGNTQVMFNPPDDPFLREVILVSGTVTTVSTVTAVTTVTTDNLATNVATTDLASTAKTTTFTQATVTPASGQISESIQIAVTAVSGTNPTMDCVVNESLDSGTNFQQIYAFQRITATGFFTTPLLRTSGNRINYVCTIAGTTPSFTMSIIHVGSQVATNLHRSYFDRTIAPNSGASTSASFSVDGCTNISYGVADTAQTTPATFDLQLSEDNSVFEKQGITIAPAANTAASINNIPLLSRWAQIVVTNAGSGETLNYAWVHCEGP